MGAVIIILQEDAEMDTVVGTIIVIFLKLQIHTQVYTSNKPQETMFQTRFLQ